jgi:hypothetical protein
MNRLCFLSTILMISEICFGASRVDFVRHANRIDVMMAGKHFTSYVHTADPQTPLVAKGRIQTKPVLFPVFSPSGTMLTRGYPFVNQMGESQDHPHHMGIYFTIDIDKENFWGNSQKPLPAIKHFAIDSMEPGLGQGTLSTTSYWIDSGGTAILQEKRVMVFQAFEADDQYAIDFTVTLKAVVDKVVFSDTKEGMMAIRVAPWLKEEDGTGQYLSDNGDRSEKNVWGKRAKWMSLQGQHQDKTYGVTIFNHPTSTNYPTYWHARGYGCFSANPLGQGAFQKGKKIKDPQYLNLTLVRGESALFKHRFLFHEGGRTKEQLEQTFNNFAASGQ